MPRQPRLDAAGILHHVMIRGIDRRNIFRNTKDRKDFIERLSVLLPETQTVCYAWSFMSNHAHFLLRSGPSGIAYLMRRLLTGYVVSFNKRHKRTGQLFQNRYKSIICDEDVYFKELVRYIHLNPIRAGLVSSMEDLNIYPYSGHSVLMGTTEQDWQDTRYVLEMFSGNEARARTLYSTYVESALNQGRRDDLSGGGLVRSLGGWEHVRDSEGRTKGDQRILGGSDFVMKVLRQAGEDYERKTLAKMKGYTTDTVADIIAGMYNTTRSEVLSKGKCPSRVEARSLFCYVASHELGMSVTDLARLIGMTPSAMTYAVRRGRNIAKEKDFRLN